MKEESEKFLVAVDCYDQSLDLVAYFSEIVQPDHHQVVLFHVLHQVPRVFFDLENELSVNSDLFPVQDWVTHERATADTFLNRARCILLDAGFSSDAMSIKVQPVRRGVARDILDESHEGYKALLVGRAETNARNETAIGTVTTKLLSRTNHIPIAVVGGKPDSDKILVGIDKSAGAMGGVDFVNSVFRDSGCEVTLYHVIRSLKLMEARYDHDDGYWPIFFPEHELRWQKMSKLKIKPVIDTARKKFVRSGWPQDKVSSRIMLDSDTRSQNLINESRNGGYGTIVVGRRGTSMVKEFFLGRVSQKVLNMGDRMAVWIIS